MQPPTVPFFFLFFFLPFASLETQTENGREAFDRLEAVGLENAHLACFTMVAGGLGERLGYNVSWTIFNFISNCPQHGPIKNMLVSRSC